MTQSEVHVMGSWWTTAVGWVYSVWAWFSHGTGPAAALVALFTLILTIIKIAQEIRAWRRDSEDRTALQKLLDALTARRSRFGKLDTTDSLPSQK